MSNERIIWDYFKAKGLNDYGVAGLMGNLYAESGLSPTNLQNSYEKKLGMSDKEYTNAVDNGSYQNFINDKAGYGLAQWTYWSLKEAMLNFARSAKKSIGDLNMQLDFLYAELSRNKHILTVLESATSVRQASDVMLLQYERPADQSISVQEKRASFGQEYFNRYANATKGAELPMGNSPLVSYKKISPNKNSPRNHVIDTISIHCVVGQCSVETLGEIFAPTSKQASCNYGIGADGRIGLYVEEKDRSWCTSSSSNDNRAITIEVASDTTHPYAVNAAAYEGLIRLLVDICQRNPGIKRLKWKGDKSLIGQVDKQNMTVHRWFANKACPGDYLYNRHGEIAAEVNRRLDELDGMEDDEEMMSIERFAELFNEFRKGLQDNDSGAYSEQARQWAKDTGLIAGNGTTINGEPNCMWQDFMTREQFVTVLYRFAQMMGKA